MCACLFSCDDPQHSCDWHERSLQGDAPQQHGHFSGHGMSRAGGQAINNYNRSEGQNVRGLAEMHSTLFTAGC